MDIGILIAKDHELEGFNSSLKAELGEFKPTRTDQGFAYWQGTLKGQRIAYTYMNSMGFVNALTSTAQYLEAVRPKYLITVGICGGKKVADLKRVHFITGCVLDSNGAMAYKPNPQYTPVGLWRSATADGTRDDPRGAFHKSDKDDGVLSANVLTLLAAKPSAYAPQTLAPHPDCSVVDMEIGGIWTTVSTWNAANKSLPCTLLPAIKAVSDAGATKEESEKQRLENVKPAVENASRALSSYLDWIITTFVAKSSN